jgi:hypothetical protein
MAGERETMMSSVACHLTRAHDGPAPS